MMSIDNDYTIAPDRLALSSQQDVTYSCGSCGYMLNLSSCNRNTTKINSKYCKSIRKGVISFDTIDESRFSQNDELSCKPYFMSKISWGFFQRRTRLLCRKCGNYVGHAYDNHTSQGKSSNLDYITGNGAPCKKYCIKINTLQPSESGTLLLT